MVENCVFCGIVKGNIPSERILESENFIVIRDVNAKVKGHSLVISKRHFENFMEMDEGLDGEMLGLVREVVRKEGWEDFNLVTNNGKSAGQIIGHVHFHILPRVEGDGFSFGI